MNGHILVPLEQIARPAESIPFLLSEQILLAWLLLWPRHPFRSSLAVVWWMAQPLPMPSGAGHQSCPALPFPKPFYWCEFRRVMAELVTNSLPKQPAFLPPLFFSKLFGAHHAELIQLAIYPL